VSSSTDRPSTISPMQLKLNNIFTGSRLKRFYSNTRPVSKILHHEWIVGGKVVPDTDVSKRKTVLFLHGLLGNGKNLRSPAKKLTSSHPNLSALVLDIRGHGNSHQTATNPLSTARQSSSAHTIESCSHDIIDTVQALNLTGTEHSPIGVVGHSLGGRCALQYTHSLIKQQQNAVSPPEHTWLLDTVPGKAHESVAQVVKAISSVPIPVKDKKELVQILTHDNGLDLSIASWMTTNLKPSSDGGFEFIFDLDVAQSILDDFPKQDFISMVQDCLVSAKGKNKLHLVIAGKNSAWTDEIVTQLHNMNSTMIDGSMLEMTTLTKAGHWVHVDDLEGLMEILERGFK